MEADAAYLIPEKNKTAVGELTSTAPVEEGAGVGAGLGEGDEEELPPLPEGKTVFCEVRELAPPQAIVQRSKMKTASRLDRKSLWRLG